MSRETTELGSWAIGVVTGALLATTAISNATGHRPSDLARAVWWNIQEAFNQDSNITIVVRDDRRRGDRKR